MIRLLLPVALSLTLAGCKPSGLQTIEEGEAYAQAHGVALTAKAETTGVLVAPRVYGYKANEAVDFHVFQFASENAATTWKRGMDNLPVGGETRIQKGQVVFTVWGATDAERQKVIDALR